jgi:hypothetical protein
MWTLRDLPPGVDAWVLQQRCCVGECTGRVAGCVTVDHGTQWARSSEKRCFCAAHAREVMQAVCLPFIPSQEGVVKSQNKKTRRKTEKWVENLSASSAEKHHAEIPERSS